MTTDGEFHRRLAGLESWRQEIEISRAREDENRRHMDRRFDALEGNIGEIKDTFKRGLWILATVIIGAAATFVLRGGLVN